MEHKTRNSILLAIIAIAVVVIPTMLIKIEVIDEYTAQILTLAGINAIIAISLNLISGITGQLALGHAGFMAIGAYTTSSLTMQLGLPLPLAIIGGGFMTAVFGFIIGFPTLKLSGDYLAIVTLGFGEIIRVVLINMKGITGGAAGLKGVPGFTADILAQPVISFAVVTATLVLILAGITNFLLSSYGRAIISIREDEIAAASNGIPVFFYKMFSFTISAFLAGIAGGLYAPFFGYLNPTMFTFLKSVDFLIIVVLGGMGSITGTIIASYVLTYLQEFLRFLKDYRLVIYPFILIFIMLFRPKGLLGRSELSLVGLLNRVLQWRASKAKDDKEARR